MSVAIADAVHWLDTTHAGGWFFTGLLLLICALCWMGRKG